MKKVNLDFVTCPECKFPVFDVDNFNGICDDCIAERFGIHWEDEMDGFKSCPKSEVTDHEMELDLENRQGDEE